MSHVLPYVKPNERPQPPMSPPVRPEELESKEPSSHKLLRLKNLLHNFGRSGVVFCDDRAQPVEPWTIFQSKVESDRLTDPATVLFNPIVMASPTDFSTVYTTLKRTKEQMNALGQSVCPIFFDMGLLSKALEIVWANKSELDGVVPLEGGMHFLMACFSGIGFLYGEIGLKELLYESDVFAKGTADHILSGKDFDRALRAILMVDEVLHRQLFQNFQKWLAKHNENIPEDLLSEVSHCLENLSQTETDTLNSILVKIESTIVPLIEQFKAEGREASPLFSLWDDYLINVSEPIKVFLASSRHSIWDAHLHSKMTLLPFFFASNRSVYARYMTYIVLSMSRLPDRACESFSKGHFVAKLTDGTFNSVWMDYILEVTENKALKSSGGIIGLTHNENALVRWFLSRPVTASYSMAYKEKESADQQTKKTHHTNTSFFKGNFNADVSKMSELFSETFIDPFSLSNPPSRLVNFATGIELNEESETSLLNCHREGKAMLQKFVNERFVVQEGTGQPSKSFFEPVPKSKVKTMKAGKTFVKCKSKEVPIGREEMYLRLLAINSFKKVPLERVMSFENAPVPLSLFDDNGKMVANKKSDFMEKLEFLLDPTLIVKDIDAVDAIIFDGMAVIQMLKPVVSPVKTTYSDLASIFWSYVLNKSQGINTIHVVFDRYFENSLKSQTREKRGEHSTVTTNIQPQMKVTDMKKIMTSSKCKSQIASFYTKYISEQAHDLIPSSVSVFVSGGMEEKVLKIKNDCISYVQELESNQEEADTRMLLHVKHCRNLAAKRIVLFSPDTDVLLLLLHHYFDLGVQEIFFKTGKTGVYTNYTRFIPIHHLVECLTTEQRQILLSVYCISGCDTTSSLFGIGKKKVFKVMLSCAKDFQKIAGMGTDDNLSVETRYECVKFIGILYGASNCTSLNRLRTEKVLKNKSTKPRKLPPTDDSFLLHLLRCHYQLIVWKGCLSPIQHLPEPQDFGYIFNTGTGLLTPQLMSQPVAPPELLSDLVCDCVDLCEQGCICSLNEQPCTQACDCKANVDGNDVCMNIFTILAIIRDDTC